MSPTADLLALLGLLETLKKQHRAGVTPTYGQVDDLFQHADAVRQALADRGFDAPIPGWGAKVEPEASLRQALAEADRRAQDTQVRILEVEDENRQLRERLKAVAEVVMSRELAASVGL